ncbi:2-keto-4-pentenoate hydratase [Streptomyces sp. M10(2022)]
MVDAYEIQLINIRGRLAAGAGVRGHKVGLSSKVMQQMMGVDEPDYGHLLDDMVLPQESAVVAGATASPYRGRDRLRPRRGPARCRLHGEGRPRCHGVHRAQHRAHRQPHPELADRARRHDRRQRLLRRGRPGRGPQRPDRLDLTDIDAVLYRGSEEIAQGNTRAVLGDPTEAVAWLARKVASFGVRLEAGHLILPGSCTRAVDVCPGRGTGPSSRGSAPCRSAS